MITKLFEQNLFISALHEPQHITKCAKDATKFTVSVTHNVQNTSSCMPKPFLRRLGNPTYIAFTMHDGQIAVGRPDD